VAVLRTGQWAQATQLISGASRRMRGAVNAALRQEAHALRNEIVQGLTSQAPGGEPIRPPAPLTLVARELRGFEGTKALLVRGDLRNSILVVIKGDEAFIGVSRTRKGRKGKPLVDVAQVHEFGGPPVVIPITPRMRRFLAVLFKRAGKAPSQGTGKGVVVVQVPARPFLRPAFNRFRQRAAERFLGRVAKELGFGGLG
jgi:phage gpG-like protein